MSRNGSAPELKETGFLFKEYCVKCKKVVDYPILTGKSHSLLAKCPSCGITHQLRDLKEQYFTKTDLFVTEFKFGNARGVVAGRLTKLPKK